MRKSERTRQYIIEKTAPVFNTQGFFGTTLTALQEATGLTKGSLYGNFADKEEIAREVFAYSMKKTRNAVLISVTGKQTARDKLLGVLSFYSNHVFNSPIPGGCPILNNAIEADDFHPSFKTTVATEISSTINFIAALLEEGVRQKEFMPDIKCKEIATVLFASFEGALMISRVSSSEKAMKIIVKHCKEILDQISFK